MELPSQGSFFYLIYKIKRNIITLTKEKGVILNGRKLFFIIIFLFFLIYFFVGIIYFEKITYNLGNFYYKKHNFQNAAFCYKLALDYDTALLKIPFSDKKFLEKQTDFLYMKAADCYTESGDILKAAAFYGDILSQYKNKNIENEDFINYIELERAVNYSKLGYFDKALQTYTKLQGWYPQLLIQTYLSMKNYEKAEEILFSDKIQEVINDGDDIDAATLTCQLMRYYKEKGNYDKIEEFTNKNHDNIENSLISKFILADLYETKGEYQKAYDLYEELLIMPQLKNSTNFSLLVHYAVLASKTGKTEEAKEIFKEIENSQKYLYRYSPQKICLYYYGGQIFINKQKSMENHAKNLLKKLNLGQESYFSGNIEDFCSFNTQL